MSIFFSILYLFLAICPLVLGVLLSKSAFAKFFYAILIFLTFQISYGFYIEGSINEKALTYILICNYLCLAYIFVEKKLNLGLNTSLQTNGLENSISFKNKYLFSFLFGLASLYFLIRSIGGLDSIIANWIIIKEEVSENSVSRIIATCCFFISASFLLMAKHERFNLSWILIISITLLMFVLILRTKIFLVPLAIAIFIPINQKVEYIRLISFSIFFIFLYIFVMTFRWLGDLEGVSMESIITSLNNVLSAGVERETFHQFSSIFSYYEINEKVYLSSYLRYILIVFDKLLLINIAPENPMYFYSTIAGDFSFQAGGSAHPTIYADSYAQFGWLGIVIPFLILSVMSFSLNDNNISFYNCLKIILMYFSMILFLRGSSFYGLFYLTPVIILFLFNLYFSLLERFLDVAYFKK